MPTLAERLVDLIEEQNREAEDDDEYLAELLVPALFGALVDELGQHRVGSVLRPLIPAVDAPSPLESREPGPDDKTPPAPPPGPWDEWTAEDIACEVAPWDETK